MTFTSCQRSFTLQCDSELLGLRLTFGPQHRELPFLNSSEVESLCRKRNLYGSLLVFRESSSSPRPITGCDSEFVFGVLPVHWSLVTLPGGWEFVLIIVLGLQVLKGFGYAVSYRRLLVARVLYIIL